MFSVVSGGVDDNYVSRKVVCLHVGKCALKCERFVLSDVILLFWFVVVIVSDVKCRLNFCGCSFAVVAVVVEPDFLQVVVVVVVIVMDGRRWCRMAKRHRVGKGSE